MYPMNKDDTNDEGKGDTSAKKGKPLSDGEKPDAKHLFTTEKETESGNKKKSKADGKTASPARTSPARTAVKKRD